MTFPNNVLFFFLISFSCLFSFSCLALESEISISTGIQHDDQLISIDEDQVKNQADFAQRFATNLQVSGSLKPQDQWTVMLDWQQSQYSKASEYDVTTLLGSLSYEWQWDSYSTGMTLILANAEQNSRKYLTLTQLAPNIGLFLTPYWYMQWEIGLSEERYPDWQEKNGGANIVRTRHFFLLDSTQHYFAFQAQAQNFSADDSEYSFDSVLFKLKHSYNAHWYQQDLTLQTEISKEKRRYDNQRSDDATQLNLEIEYPFWKQAYFSLSYAWHDNASSDADLSFTQRQWSSEIGYRW